MAGIATAAAASGGDGGPNVETIIAGAGALLTATGLFLYLIGSIRPLGVRNATWRRHCNRVAFSCYLKNRSPLYDRTVTELVLVEQPSARFDRLFRVWRKQWQPVRIVLDSPANDKIRDGTLKVTKNDELLIEGELREGNGPGVPGGRIHIEARAGSKRSRSRPLREQSGPPQRDPGRRRPGSMGSGLPDNDPRE